MHSQPTVRLNTRRMVHHSRPHMERHPNRINNNMDHTNHKRNPMQHHKQHQDQQLLHLDGALLHVLSGLLVPAFLLRLHLQLLPLLHLLATVGHQQ
jgi:hypothetical protein